MEPKRLYRSRTDRMLGGVCAGLAQYTNMDPTVMRIIFVLVSLFITAGLGGVIAYVVLWAVIQEEPGTVPQAPPAPPAL